MKSIPKSREINPTKSLEERKVEALEKIARSLMTTSQLENLPADNWDVFSRRYDW